MPCPAHFKNPNTVVKYRRHMGVRSCHNIVMEQFVFTIETLLGIKLSFTMNLLCLFVLQKDFSLNSGYT